MSVHIKLTGLEPDEFRSLLEPCNFCDARAGEPCILKQWICPDANCEQLYQSADSAMNCTHMENQ